MSVDQTEEEVGHGRATTGQDTALQKRISQFPRGDARYVSSPEEQIEDLKSVTLEDVRPGTFEKAEFGFTTTSWNGLEGFAKGEAEFGGHTDGFAGSLGVRWRW